MAKASTGTLANWYSAESEFKFTLKDALVLAETAIEKAFAHKVAKDYESYGMAMLWTEAQDKTLRRVAGPDD